MLQLERVEEIRGSIAGWLLVAFGAVYFLGGLGHALAGFILRACGLAMTVFGM